MKAWFRFKCLLLRPALLIILTSVGLSSASAVTNAPFCSEVIPALDQAARAAKVDLPENTLKELRIAQQKFFERLEENQAQSLPKGVPATLKFNDQRLTVLAYLGAGGEGRVFVVSKNRTKYVLKVFYNETKMTNNLTFAQRIRDRGRNILIPLATDWERSSVILRYVDGINVGAIIQPDPFRPALVSPETAQLVREAFKNFIHGMSENFHPDNVVIDLENHEFVIIDSR